jgi:adenine deaminase
MSQLVRFGNEGEGVLKTDSTRQELIEVAQGRRQADLYIKGGTVINVYSGEYLSFNVAVYKDRIAYVGDSEAMVGEKTIVIDAQGKYVSPGFIEPHAHPWVIYNPVSYVTKVLTLGTTTIAHDNLFFYLHMGPKGFRDMVKDLRQLPGNNYWLVRLVSQAMYDEEREEFNSEAIRGLLEMEEVVGTAEVTRWPLLYQGDPLLLELVEYSKRSGKVSDGHTAGCSYDKLNSLVAAGVSACHEAITAKEALDRLRLGMWTTLRNSSLRPDFPELIKLITEGRVNTSRVLMTTDGPHPAFIEEQGCIGGLVSRAVELGLSPMQAVQMATINPATYLKKDELIGGIAPGRRADILILPDLVHFRPELVISGGTMAAKDGRLLLPVPPINWDKYNLREAFAIKRDVLADPELYSYPRVHAESEVPVAFFRSTVITQLKKMGLPAVGNYVDVTKQEGLLLANLIDRDGKWITRGILENFAVSIDGLASTYNTTTHLLAIGRDPQAMAKAAQRVHELGGGIVLVDRGEIVLEIPLPLTGMMTTDPEFSTAVEYQTALLSAVKERGYPFHDILYTLLFLTCDFLPGPRLTPKGVYDVKTSTIVSPAVSLERKGCRT